MDTLASIRDKSPINGSHIKLAAIIFMFIDHFAASILLDAILYDGADAAALYDFLRTLGRFSFPVYCFFIVEGYRYTHDVTAYIRRLLIFGVISEIPFDMALHGQIISMSGCNVYFTLALGLILIAVCDKYPAAQDLAIRMITLIAVCALAYFLNTDYSVVGVGLIAVFYAFRNNRLITALIGSVFIFAESPGIAVAIPVALFFLAIILYNGLRGTQRKWLFYGFYPLHLFILGLIRIC